MSYAKITNLDSGKVELELGIRPEPFFTDVNGARNPQDPILKTSEELIRDVMADAAFTDFKREKRNE